MANIDYSCGCGCRWNYTGDTCTTFRDGGTQDWNGDKSERIDLCPECNTQGTVTNPKKGVPGFTTTDNGTVGGNWNL